MACVVLIVVMTVVLVGNSFGWASAFGYGVIVKSDTYYPVTYVVDGDTFKINASQDEATQKIVTIRVLGINTPETVDPRKSVECYGPEASQAGRDVLNGHKVKLTFSPNRELKDKYDRYLAYVYRDDGLFYNEYMLKNGFAKEYTFGTPYSMQSEFRGIEKEARGAKVGLWSACH